MRIAMLVPALANKGPVIVAKELVEVYMKKGHTCMIFYFDNIHEIEFPCPTRKIKFFHKIDLNNFDILHSHTFRPDLYVFLCSLFSIHKRKIKFISTLHQPLTYNAIVQNKNKFTSWIYFYLSKLSHKVMDVNVLLSNEQLELSRANLLSKINIVIPNGRDVIKDDIINKNDRIIIEEFKKKFKILGTISVVTPRKGIEQVIKALVLLTDYVFICVGEGQSLENLKKMAHELGVSERCVWLGYRKDGVNYQRYFDIFVMTTRSEGFPLSFIEAAAYGTPTVLSDIPILKAIANDNDVCFYELDNISSLVENINRCYENRVNYSNNIYKHYLENLTATIMGERYLDLYYSITE